MLSVKYKGGGLICWWGINNKNTEKRVRRGCWPPHGIKGRVQCLIFKKKHKRNNGANQNFNNYKTSSASLTFLSVDQENFGVLQIKLLGELDISSRLSHLPVSIPHVLFNDVRTAGCAVVRNRKQPLRILFHLLYSRLFSHKIMKNSKVFFFSEVISLFSLIFTVGCLLYVWEKVTSKDIIPVLKHEHFEI